jgi:hypothetical protein
MHDSDILIQSLSSVILCASEAHEASSLEAEVARATPGAFVYRPHAMICSPLGWGEGEGWALAGPVSMHH